MTRQRKVILDTMKGVTSHPTADQVYQMVRRRLPHVSLATVYRNLEILSEHGMIQKLELAGAQRRFDGNVESHYHVRCTRCGRTEDLPMEIIPHLDSMVQGISDFDVAGHRLEFMGLCPKCKSENKDIAGPGKTYSPSTQTNE